MSGDVGALVAEARALLDASTSAEWETHTRGRHSGAITFIGERRVEVIADLYMFDNSKANADFIVWAHKNIAQLADALIAATEREQRVRASVAKLHADADTVEDATGNEPPRVQGYVIGLKAAARDIERALDDTAERGTLGATTATDAGGEQ